MAATWRCKVEGLAICENETTRVGRGSREGGVQVQAVIGAHLFRKVVTVSVSVKITSVLVYDRVAATLTGIADP
jgi:hypothetical protein